MYLLENQSLVKTVSGILFELVTIIINIIIIIINNTNNYYYYYGFL